MLYNLQWKEAIYLTIDTLSAAHLQFKQKQINQKVEFWKFIETHQSNFGWDFFTSAFLTSQSRWISFYGKQFVVWNDWA